MTRRLIPVALALLVAGCASVRVVCPAGSADAACEFTGDEAIQAAVDAAQDGDTVLIRAGRYSPRQVRDVTFGELVIRGYVVVDGRRIVLRGESGTVLDGQTGLPATAIVVRGGRAEVRNLILRGFRHEDPEDDIYEGHGLFFIDAVATISNVEIVGAAKMALVLRGTAQVDASAIRLLDGHVGVWLEETARLQLDNAAIRGNDSAGICTYGQSSALVRRSTIEGNRDDGVYAADDSIITVEESQVVGNTPLDFNTRDRGRVAVTPGAAPASRP